MQRSLRIIDSGAMGPQGNTERPLIFSVDTFTKRGTYEADDAPFTISEYNKFYAAYMEYLSGARSIKAKFFTGQLIEVKYNFKDTRPEKDRLLIDWDDLVPVFGGKMPPGDRNYVRVPKILQFIEEKVKLNECRASARDTCFCGKKPNEVNASESSECPDKHLHHFCWAHVSSWVTGYLIPTILLKESKELFHAVIAEEYGDNPRVLEHYATGDRTDTEVLLEAIRNIDNSRRIAPKIRCEI